MQTTGKNQNSESSENNVAEILIDLITDENGIVSGMEKVAFRQFHPQVPEIKEMATVMPGSTSRTFWGHFLLASEAKSYKSKCPASAALCLSQKWSK